MKNNDTPTIYDDLRAELNTDQADLSPVHFIIRPEPEITIDPDEVRS